MLPAWRQPDPPRPQPRHRHWQPCASSPSPQNENARHKQGKTIASLLWAAAAPTLLDAMQVTFSRLAGGDEAHGKAGVHCALKKRRRPGARWRHFGRGAWPGAWPCGSWSLGRPCEKPGAARYCLLLLLPHVCSSPGAPPCLELARAEACGALPGARPGAICREEQRPGAAGRRGLELQGGAEAWSQRRDLEATTRGRSESRGRGRSGSPTFELYKDVIEK